METYEVTFSEGVNYKTTVVAEDETEAFIKARDEATSKGIRLPVEVWTHIEKIEKQ
jgi:hypothetical protein